MKKSDILLIAKPIEYMRQAFWAYTKGVLYLFSIHIEFDKMQIPYCIGNGYKCLLRV